MKITIPSLKAESIQHGETLTVKLQQAINAVIADYTDEFVQDMTHISTAANYNGNIAVDKVTYVKDNLYRCDYSYDWAIAWTCSGTQEAGRVNEKVRFTVDNSGELTFKFLKLDM